jgi:hypothetical protein
MHVHYILDAKQKREDANTLIFIKLSKAEAVLESTIETIEHKPLTKTIHKKYNLH